MPTTFLGGDLKLAADLAVANPDEILLATKSFSLGVETEGMEEGDSTQVFVAGSVPKAKAFDRKDNNYMTDNGGEHAWKTHTLDYHAKSSFVIARKFFNKLTPQKMAALLKRHVTAVVSKIVDDSFAKITTLAFPNFFNAGPALNFDEGAVNEIETELAKLIGSNSERNLILNMDHFSGLRKNLVNIPPAPTNNEVLLSGIIPGITGFANVIRTTALKSAGNENIVGFATNMSGIALSVAAVNHIPVFKDGAGEVENTIEATTGIPLTFSVDYDKDTRDYVATVEALYAISVIDKNGILCLTSTVAA
ncbi:MAG: hypothetical protein FWB90_02865 [Fibromonadales bacterium]|nr:hypothetical protein [Fibromonadales bacterium]